MPTTKVRSWSFGESSAVELLLCIASHIKAESCHKRFAHATFRDKKHALLVVIRILYINDKVGNNKVVSWIGKKLVNVKVGWS